MPQQFCITNNNIQVDYIADNSISCFTALSNADLFRRKSHRAFLLAILNYSLKFALVGWLK